MIKPIYFTFVLL